MGLLGVCFAQTFQGGSKRRGVSISCANCGLCIYQGWMTAWLRDSVGVGHRSAAGCGRFGIHGNRCLEKGVCRVDWLSAMGKAQGERQAWNL